MALLVWVFFVSGYISSRHVLPLMALAMPFTALGILYLAEQMHRFTGVRASLAVAGTLVTCTIVVLPYSVRAYNREFVPVIDATHWVHDHAQPGAGVVCNSPYVGYYGSLPTTILGPNALSLDSALAKGEPGVRFDYVVLHVDAHGYRPEWLDQIKRHYRQVGKFTDPTHSARAREVLVFEAQEAQAASNATEPRS